jgi:peptidase E
MATNLKPVYLLAGGRGRNRQTPDPLIRIALKESGKERPSVAYIGTASSDDTSFFEMLVRMFDACGAGEVTHAFITPKDADLKKAMTIIESADIVYVSGGDVERGMRALVEKDMVGFLLELYRQGKPFFGISAGSIMLAREWVRWRDPEDDATAELFPCLGIAPIICDTHDEEAGWEELQAALALKEDSTRGYGLVSSTAIKVLPDGKVEALGGAIHQFVRSGDKVKRAPDILPGTAT